MHKKPPPTVSSLLLCVCLCLALSYFLSTLISALNEPLMLTTTMPRVICTALPRSLSRSFCGIRLSHSRTHGSEWNRTLIANCNSQLAPACNTPDALTEPSCPLQCRAEEASAVMGLHAGYRRAGQCGSPPAGYGIHQSSSILRRGSGCGCHCKAAGSTATPYHRLGHQGGKIAW